MPEEFKTNRQDESATREQFLLLQMPPTAEEWRKITTGAKHITSSDEHVACEERNERTDPIPGGTGNNAKYAAQSCVVFALAMDRKTTRGVPATRTEDRPLPCSV